MHKFQSYRLSCTQTLLRLMQIILLLCLISLMCLTLTGCSHTMPVAVKTCPQLPELPQEIKDRANQSVDLIADLEYIDNVDGLRERLDELSFARRLMKAMDGSPVIGLPTPTVLDFVSNNPKLNNVLKVEGGKIKLDTKKAQSAFVSLLNDDFLYSKLTNNDYESSSKDRLRIM